MHEIQHINFGLTIDEVSKRRFTVKEQIEPKRLVDAGLCVSFAEARRMILMINETKLLDKLQAKEAEKWGRRKITGKNWKKDSLAMDNVTLA